MTVVALTKVTFMGTLNCPVRLHTRPSGGARSRHTVAAVKLSGGRSVVQMSTSIVSMPSGPGLSDKRPSRHAAEASRNRCASESDCAEQ